MQDNQGRFGFVPREVLGIFKGRSQDGLRKKARRCQMNLDRFSEEDREEQKNRKSVGGRIEGIARL